MTNPASFVTSAARNSTNTFSAENTFSAAVTMSSTLAVTGALTVTAGITGNSALTIAPAVSASGVRTALTLTGAADTGRTASTEQSDVYLNLARTVTWATGAITDQRAVRITAPTLAFVGASTVTNAATLYIDRAPQAGTNATITNAYALWVDAGKARFDGPVLINNSLTADTTDSSGTPGAATINKASGKVAIAIGASSVVVTNSLVSSASTILAVLQSVDATATTLLPVVPGSGSFTIYTNAAATAPVTVAFIVIN